MGEGALPGGVFRKAAPGEFEINIPGIAESPVNKIIRRAYRGIHKGESFVRTKDDKLYPRGFTPPVDFISDPDNKDPLTGIAIESNERIKNYDPNKESINTFERHQKLKESYLNFYDAQTLQFRHLLEYHDTEDGIITPLAVNYGKDGLSPKTFRFGEYGDLIPGTYLASYLRTHRNNEDPTILGFDFHISLPNSPIFNGTLDKFLKDNSSDNIELANRMLLLGEFQQHLLSFFKTWAPNNVSENLPSVGQFLTFDNNRELGSTKNQTLTGGLFDGNGYNNTRDTSKDFMDMIRGSATKAYYIQSISGLDKLNESNDFGSGKRFVEWGKDFITLTLNEDISQNMGYLASLYKNLAWSRERGRLAIPENLLRFEAVLDITEIRNYVRVYKSKEAVPTTTDGGNVPLPTGGAEAKFREIADYTSKYRYFLHECQFFFDKMPHGDTLNNSVQSEALKGLDLKIYFKHSNLRFMKFIPPSNIDVQNDDYSDYINRYTRYGINTNEKVFDVKLVDNSTIIPPVETTAGEKNFRELRVVYGGAPFQESNFLFQDGTKYNSQTLYNTAPIGHPLNVFNLNPRKNISVNPGLSDAARRALINQKPTFGEKLLVGLKDSLKDAKKQILNAGISFVNRKIVDAASLINRTLNQIYNSTPVIGGIKPPKNLYATPNEFEQAYIDFIGPGLKTFFEDPLKFKKEGTPGETLETKIANNRLTSPLGLGSPFISSVSSVGNSATDTDQNKTLKQIVDEDVDFGNGFSGASMIPFLGNSADETQTNKTTQQKVNENPGFGRAFAGDASSKFFSFVPETGNTAQFQRGNPKTLKQIVDSDPALGIGPIISKIAFLGNKALSTFSMLTSEQKVQIDPKIGNGSKIVKGYFSSNPDSGNNALQGGNQNLLNLVLDNSIVTTLGAFDWDNIQFPSSAQRLPDPTTSGITDIYNIIKNNSSVKNSELGNSAQVGKNNSLDNITTINSSVDDPFLGNSGDVGPNQTNESLVNTESDVVEPELGNSANEGDNELNDSKVDSYSNVDDAFDGNSAINGRNQFNDSKVDENSIVIEPELGNSAIDGDNVSNSKVVDSYSMVDEAEQGNSAIDGENKTNDFVVYKNTDVINPNLGNSALRGETSTNEQIVTNNTDLEGSFIGNSALSAQNKTKERIIENGSSVDMPEEGNSADRGAVFRLDQLITNKSKLVNAGLGNSGLFGKNIVSSIVIDKNSQLDEPSLGNSGQISDNFTNQEKINKLSELDGPGIGNSADVGGNLNVENIVSFNSKVQDEFIGNAAINGRNIPNEFKVEDNSDVELSYLGNSAEVDKNVRGTTIVEKYSKVDSAELGNSAEISGNSKINVIIENETNLENPELGNSAEMSTQNKTLNIKLENSVLKVDNSSKESPNIQTSTIVKEKSTLETPFVGNSAEYGLPRERENVVEFKSGVVYPEIGNSAPRGYTPRISNLLFNYSKVTNEEIGNSAIIGINKTIKTKLRENLIDKDFGFISKIEGGLTTIDQTSNSSTELPQTPPNLDELKEYSNSSKLLSFYDWKSYKSPKWQ